MIGKLIDADALIAELEIMPIDIGFEDIDRALQVVSEQPEAVVRCRNCKHRYEDDCSMRFVEIVQVDDDGHIHHKTLYNDNTTDDGYCSYGERRTDE